MVTRTDQNKLKFTYTEKDKSFSIPFSVKASRFVFKVLSKISENTSSKLAYYLFFRPRKQPYKQFDIEIMQESHEEIVTLNKRKIHVYSWGSNSSKKALFVHGWEGRATSGKHLLQVLLKHDFQVYSFDAPAHGKSEGKTTDLPEIIATINYMLQKYGDFHTIISHSFGSLATLHALQSKESTNNLILISSISNPYTAIKGFQKTFVLSDSIIEKIVKKIDKRFDIPFDSFKLQNDFKLNIPNIQIIHDKRDFIAPLSESLFLQKLLPKSNLEVIEYAGHHKILSNPKTLEVINQML